jgi:hypothetical protein
MISPSELVRTQDNDVGSLSIYLDPNKPYMSNNRIISHIKQLSVWSKFEPAAVK